MLLGVRKLLSQAEVTLLASKLTLMLPTGTLATAPSPGSYLVPVLPLQDGPPDAAAVAAWHLALSNLVGQDLPHDMLALWLFPDRGGVLLLAPTELARDHVQIEPPAPFLNQHQLFELEQRIRRAGYGSVVAVPVRSHTRDLGLAVFAHLEPGRYAVPQAMRLHGIVHQLVETFMGLAASPPISGTAGPAVEVTPENVVECVARAAAEGRTGSEVLRLVSGVLQALVPHERIDVAIAGQGNGVWALLSGAPEGRRWGESTGAVSQAVSGLVALAADDGTLLVEDLREGPGLAWPSYRDSRALQRVRAALGVRLSSAGADDAWMLLGGPGTGIFTEADRDVLQSVAPVIALRVQGLRASLDADVVRAQSQSMHASQLRAGRLAAMLAGTAHWGEAVALFVKDVRESLGFGEVRFALRLGDDRFVEVEPGDLRPLSSLPTTTLDASDLSLVLSGVAAFLVAGEGGTDLTVPLRVAGRIIGALQLFGGSPGSGGHPITAAQLFADLIAPHLELIRRSALPVPAARARFERAGQQ